MILPKKKKKTSDEESEASQFVTPEKCKPRLERVGDNLFIWRVPAHKGERRG